MIRTAVAPRGRRAQTIATVLDAARAHSTAVVLFHAAVAEHFGLIPTDSKTLELLERFGRMTPGELVERTGLASPSVTALVDRLESKGFVRRVRDAQDRRRVFVEVIPDGLQRIVEKLRSVKASTDALCAPYTIEQLEVIVDFLERSTDLLSQGVSGTRG